MTRLMTKMRSSLEEEYFLWLCDKVDSEAPENARGLLLDLYLYEYYPTVPNDDNRAADGQSLREHFGTETDNIGVEDYLEGACNMLEMLVALAERMNFILYDYDDTNRVSHWFWHLIHNLGLQTYSRRSRQTQRENRLKVKRFLSRGYEYDGTGGLFPLPNPRHDQRNIEVWYQMHAYIQQVLL